MTHPLNESTVSCFVGDGLEYPRTSPFHPSVRYPESPGGDVGSEPNRAYDAVRECLRIAGLDAAHFGTPQWNPLGGLIRPGETVVLKPNLVKESHPRDPEGWRYVLTHGSVIRAAADYVVKALEGKGRIIIADAPQTDSSFENIRRVLGLDDIQSYYRSRGVVFEIVDLRREEWTARDNVIYHRRKLPEDPAGYVAYDLGPHSEFAHHAGAGHYYGADYDSREVNYHHTGGRHEYLISGSVMKADVVLSLPKLKTHKKAGITVSLKNLVGVNGDKNWLPHHTEGSLRKPGDEHPHPDLRHRLERLAIRTLQKLITRFPRLGFYVYRGARGMGQTIVGDTESVIRSGNWWGNDTCWRMCLDLNKILFYGNADSSFRPAAATARKRHYVLVDGIIAGEGRGPMNPDPVRAGMVLFGCHPASVDAACAVLMGFDPNKIPIIRQAFESRGLPMTEWGWRDVAIVSNRAEWTRRLPDISPDTTFHFTPHFGWTGHIERDAAFVTR